MNHTMRRLLTDAASKSKHDPFRERIAARGVQIGAHPVGAHFQPFEECGEQVMRLARRHGEFRHGMPFHLP